MISLFKQRAAGAAIVAFALVSCGEEAAPPEDSDPALASVAGQPVTAADVRAEIEWRRANGQFVPERAKLVEEMVQRLALIERARQTGYADDPQVRRRIESLLIAALREKELDARIAALEVSDAELRAAYEERREEFTRKPLDRFALLFLEAHAKMSDARREETRQRLEEGLARAAENPAAGGRGPGAGGFGAVAIDCSDDQASRYRGGDVGWIEAGAESRWPEEVVAAGRKLDIGDRSGVIETSRGFFAIMKTDSRPGGLTPLEEVAAGLSESLLRERRRAMEEFFVEETLRLAEARIDGKAVAAADLPAGTPPPPPAPETPPAFPGIAVPDESASR